MFSKQHYLNWHAHVAKQFNSIWIKMYTVWKCHENWYSKWGKMSSVWWNVGFKMSLLPSIFPVNFFFLSEYIFKYELRTEIWIHSFTSGKVLPCYYLIIYVISLPLFWLIRYHILILTIQLFYLHSLYYYNSVMMGQFWIFKNACLTPLWDWKASFSPPVHKWDTELQMYLSEFAWAVKSCNISLNRMFALDCPGNESTSTLIYSEM